MFVELEVISTEPGFKGDTATGATNPLPWKPMLKSVPLFENGDVIKIDTRTGDYIERVKLNGFTILRVEVLIWVIC